MTKNEINRLILQGLKVPRLFICLLLIFLSGCDNTITEQPGSSARQAFVEVNGIQVPVFSKVEEQLNFTRSWFANIQERRAALEAFITLYPQEKRYCGLSALELAYLELGGDFRFAHKYDGFAAIKAYKAIIDEYPEYQDMQAKAHWYLGWIYSDLLQDKKKGAEHYQMIVKQYPLESVILLPPASWVSIIYQTDETINTALRYRPVNYWASLALVELIRYAEDSDSAWEAFSELWENYRNNIATGFGLRLMLQKRYRTNETLNIARLYMEKEFSNVYLLGDIQKEINAIKGVEGGAGL